MTLEIDALPDIQRLIASGEFVVYLAQAAQIPVVLQEIGRLREVTFRSTGEGTGKAIDGLILVDLTTTQTKLLRRFLGQDRWPDPRSPSRIAVVPSRARAL